MCFAPYFRCVGVQPALLSGVCIEDDKYKPNFWQNDTSNSQKLIPFYLVPLVLAYAALIVGIITVSAFRISQLFPVCDP